MIWILFFISTEIAFQSFVPRNSNEGLPAVVLTEGRK